ncbi:MAG: FmdE family protein [Methanomassiliicoccales archaeon]
MEGDTSPRDPLWERVRSGRLDDLLRLAGEFHGHYCPGLALGIRAGADMVNWMRAEHEGMEDVLAVVETNNCFSDGIQFSTGCTLGNNALVYRDLGKTAASLVRRDGSGIRYCVRPGGMEIWEEHLPEYPRLFQKVIARREGNREDMERFKELGKKASFMILDMPREKLFDVREVSIEVPEYAPIHESHLCAGCGESVMATRTVDVEGERYCLPCAGEAFLELTGEGIRPQR